MPPRRRYIVGPHTRARITDLPSQLFRSHPFHELGERGPPTARIELISICRHETSTVQHDVVDRPPRAAFEQLILD
jgi:hypothetical protein